MGYVNKASAPARSTAVSTANDNRLSKVWSDASGSTTTYYTYDEADQIASVTEDGTPTYYTWHARGRLTEKTTNGSTTYFTWTEDDLLASISKPGTTAYYHYDSQRRRIAKVVDGTPTYFVYDLDWNAIAEYDGGMSLQAADVTVGVDDHLARIEDSTPYYFYDDALETVAGLTDSGGQRVAYYQYDAWGNEWSWNPGSLSNPFLYTGAIYDPESGLLYLRNRYLDTTSGRFLSPDPLRAILHTRLVAHVRLFSTALASYNTAGSSSALATLCDQVLGSLYTYAASMPTSFSDPLGLVEPGTALLLYLLGVALAIAVAFYAWWVGHHVIDAAARQLIAGRIKEEVLKGKLHGTFAQSFGSVPLPDSIRDVIEHIIFQGGKITYSKIESTDVVWVVLPDMKTAHYRVRIKYTLRVRTKDGQEVGQTAYATAAEGEVEVCVPGTKKLPTR